MTVFLPSHAEYLHLNATALGRTCLTSESQWYADGYIHNADESAWNFQLNAAALAACMFKYHLDDDPNEATYRTLAIQIVERAFRRNLYHYPDGIRFRFSDGIEGVVDEPQGTDDTTQVEAISSITSTLYYLWDSIPRKTRKRWLYYMMGCLDFLTTINYPYYYINGNYVMHFCLCYWQVAELCRRNGDIENYKKWNATYEVMLNVAFFPYPTINTTTQWQGYGLVIDGGTANIDWSSYIAHLSETNSYVGPNPVNTWDPVYAQLGLDLCAYMYLFNRDWRLFKLLNAWHNKIEPVMDFTNPNQVLINCNGGSRNPAGGIRGFVSLWPQVIYLLGSRTNNRTRFNDATCQGLFNTMSPSMTQLLPYDQTASFTFRQWHLAVAGQIHCANIANREIV